MKANKFILAALASLTFAGCASDEFTGNEDALRPAPLQIQFASGSARITRADLTGADAAAALNNTFRVYGTSGTGSSVTPEFDNFVVDYNGNIGSDSTNTHGWTYLGQTSMGVNPAVQGVKYWNLSAPEYDFVAFSGLADNIRITSTESNIIYVDDTNKDKLFISDRATAKYAASSTGKTQNVQYGQGPVTLTFKRIQARVRIGMYETVPGYAVKNVRFYYDDNYLAQAGTSTKTVAGLRGTFPTSGSYEITYDENNEVVATLTSGSTANSFQFGELDYTTAESSLVAGGYMKEDGSVDPTTGDPVFLATSSAQPTFAKKNAVLDGATVANSDWQPVLPLSTNAVNLVLRADFTLVSLDGVGAPIEVKGASAVVPVAYAQWKPNYAYTYIFKISDRTNGTTTDHPDPNPQDPDNPNPDPNPGVDEGLYPITFDAVVSSVENAQQETITGITALGGDAITTYSETSDVTNAGEYKVGEVITVSSISTGYWSIAYSAVEPTEQQVADMNTYSYTALSGSTASSSAQFTVEKAGYYIVRLRYLPTGKPDTEANYVDTFKVIKTVN